MAKPEVGIALSLETAKDLFALLAAAGHAGAYGQKLSDDLTDDLIHTAAILRMHIDAAEALQEGGGADPRMN